MLRTYAMATNTFGTTCYELMRWLQIHLEQRVLRTYAMATNTFGTTCSELTRWLQIHLELMRWLHLERERTYVPRYLCSPVGLHMFPGAYVPRYLCSPVPMFPGFCCLIVVIRIHRLQISINRLQNPRPVR